MNSEGLGLEVSPEWLHGTATGFVLLVSAYWLAYFVLRGWRYYLWYEGVNEWSVLEERYGAKILPRWTGWRCTLPKGLLLSSSAGVFEECTTLRWPSGAAYRTAGVASVLWIEEHIERGVPPSSVGSGCVET